MNDDRKCDSILPPGWPVDSDWTERLREHFASASFRTLMDFVERERLAHTVYPPLEDVFNSFRLTPYSKTKVVILGQDPYHGPHQAHGLSFSVLSNVKLPPSLKNIFKDLVSDLGGELPTHGDLSWWGEEGVLLLNTVLTVRDGVANSHRKQGWETLTDEVIRQLSQHESRIVFLLWGKPAEKKIPLIANHHRAIISAHPSPLSASRGFLGSRPFSRSNEYLREVGRGEIDWSIRPKR